MGQRGLEVRVEYVSLDMIHPGLGPDLQVSHSLECAHWMTPINTGVKPMMETMDIVMRTV